MKWLVIRICSVISVALVVSMGAQHVGAEYLSAPGETVEGTWFGTMKVSPDAEWRIVIEIFPKASEERGASFVIIEQYGTGVPVNEIILEENRLRLVMDSVGFSYAGEIAADGERIEGELRLGEQTFPLVVERVDEVPGLSRPQMSRGPYPYVEEEVSYSNPEAGVTLAGTLTRPREGERFPAVLLISGSGMQDRDETVAYHRPFRLLADYLTRRGIAVLRVDDRGFGHSTGAFATATTADFAADARASVAYLRGRADIDAERVGLIGHSEGGTVATLVAAADHDLAGIVMLAGLGVTGEQFLFRQRTDLGRSAGLSEAQLAASLGWYDEMHAIMRAEADLAGAANTIRQRFVAMAPERKALIGWSDQVFAAVLATIANPWYRYVLDFDPAPALSQVRCPVLALNGAKDIQAAADQNLPAIAAALQAGGNPDFEVVELPDLNHLFQTADTGAPTEYMEISETMAPVALRTIGDWILPRLGLPPIETAVGERRDQATPALPELWPNYPNPFNADTVIRYTTPVDGPVSLRIFNLAGQRVAALVSDFRSAGAYAFHWDGRDDEGTALASGVFFYQLQTGTQTQTRSLLLLR